MVDQGKLIAAGPLGKNENNYRGIFILNNVKTFEEAKDIIRYLDEEFQYLNNKLDSEIKDLRKEFADLNIKTSIIKNDLSMEINDTRKLIIDSSVSNIWSETFGLICLFIDLILGTAPDFIQYLLY